VLLPNQLKQFVLEPKFYWLATRNDEFLSEAHRVLGLRISGPDSLQIFIYQGTGAQSIKNLQSNKLVSFSITNAFNFESYQIKGRLLELRPASNEEEQFMADYIQEISKMVAALGLPYAEGVVVAQTKYQPAWSIEFEIDQIFDQTPKIGTGKLLKIA
jgi:hypothetical protein